MTWFLGSFLNLPRWLWVIIGAALLLIAGIVYINWTEAADDKANQEIGAAVEREEALQETVKRVETANEVREEIAKPGPVGDQLRYDQCLRTARTPKNCERFLPQRPAD